MYENFGNYTNGYIERCSGGAYNGKLFIEGVDVSPIEGVYFQAEHKNYLWIKRRPIMEYDMERQTYIVRKRKPQVECYLEKQTKNNTVAYKGEFVFLRFKYSIVGVWDDVLGKDKQRLNLFVDRLPMSEQTILKNINERNKKQRP